MEAIGKNSVRRRLWLLPLAAFLSSKSIRSALAIKYVLRVLLVLPLPTLLLKREAGRTVLGSNQEYDYIFPHVAPRKK
ncbi:hypothetical protein CFP56_016609 [Quercus suber]|uniref:Uncharacterized protein n=1 Tax=Quercus suber TaxID=58331 RepID=A0AAW0KPK3_QUESU